MNAAIVCPNDYSTVQFCKGIIHELRNYNNCNVYVISDVYGENTNGYYTRILESWGTKHIYLKMNRFINPVEDFKCCYALYKIFRKENIDVVINISTKPNIYGTVTAKMAGANKILCSIWGRGRVFVENSGENNLLKSLLLSLYWVSFKLCTRAWFTNINDFNYFINHKIVTKSKTILTKNYVSTDDYRPYVLSNERLFELRKEFELEDDDKMVIMVGRMIWAKGVKEFIEASKILKNRLPKTKFILVGPEEKGSPDAIPEEYLDENKTTENFRWVGFRKDVKDLYALADIAVLPSYYKEGGYPRALTEPMAMGKPVIAADSTDCRAPVEHGKNGYLVPTKNSQELANAIEILINDDNQRKEFGLYSRIKAEREYDEKVIVKQVIEEFLQ